jgi:hypothetical protein
VWISQNLHRYGDHLKGTSIIILSPPLQLYLHKINLVLQFCSWGPSLSIFCNNTRFTSCDSLCLTYLLLHKQGN